MSQSNSNSKPANFTSIPILDYSQSTNPLTLPTFLSQLQHALINVGFIYLSNTPIDPNLIKELKSYIPRLFGLPQEEKDKIGKVNSPYFLGYSRLGGEWTKGEVDYREQFDFGTECEGSTKGEGEKEYLNIYGPSQYPNEELIPGFKHTMETYISQLYALADEFIRLVSRALGFEPDTLARFYEGQGLMQLSKIVQYPVQTKSQQGVGPHYDSGFLTILLQASDHPGLQAQNLSGEWIDVPPKEGTFVVNFGKSLEYVTQGAARATSHRVLAPPLDSKSPRYSVPFFYSGMNLEVKLGENLLELSPDIQKLLDERGVLGATESINYTEYAHEPAGKVYLIGRIKSHPDVGERFYPHTFKELFPEGLPEHGVAY